MSTLVIKNIPESLHERVRRLAADNRRSMTQEAIVLIELGLRTSSPRRKVALPPPIRLKGGPVTTEWIEAAIAAGRD